MPDPVRKLSRTEAGRGGLVVDGKSWAIRLPRAADAVAGPCAHSDNPPSHVRDQNPGKKSPDQALRRSSQVLFPQKKQREGKNRLKVKSCGKK